MAHIRSLLPVLWEKSGGICALCGKPLDPDNIHIDHIVPRTRGGTNDLSNLQAVHKSCNSRKHTLSLEDAVARIRTTPVGHWKSEPFVHLILDPEIVERIDDFRFAFRFSSRNAAIRALIEAGLEAELPPTNIKADKPRKPKRTGNR